MKFAIHPSTFLAILFITVANHANALVVGVEEVFTLNFDQLELISEGNNLSRNWAKFTIEFSELDIFDPLDFADLSANETSIDLPPFYSDGIGADRVSAYGSLSREFNGVWNDRQGAIRWETTGGSVDIRRITILLYDRQTRNIYRSTFELDSAVVPVPATIWLLGTGIVGLLGAQLRQQSLPSPL